MEEKKLEYHVRRYAEDPEYRKRMLEYQKKYRERVRSDKNLHDETRRRRNLRYNTDNEYRRRINERSRAMYHRIHPDAKYKPNTYLLQ